MSELQGQIQHQGPEQSTEHQHGGAELQGFSLRPPAFQLSASPIQRQTPIQRDEPDYDALVEQAVPIIENIQELARHIENGRQVNLEYGVLYGTQLRDVFQQVQAMGGTNTEFIRRIQAEMGSDAFDTLHIGLHDMGLQEVLEGATGIRVKNMYTSDLQVSGGGQSFSIRSSPDVSSDSNILGELNHSLEYLGEFTRKVVDEESGTEFLAIRVRRTGITGISLNNGRTLEDLPEEVYVGMGGLRVTVSWSVFMEQLEAFDMVTSGMSLTEKLTLLRQFGQKKDMGERMDAELGQGARTRRHPFENPRYEDDRTSYDNIFQMLKEVDQVNTPLGPVDMHHFLIALESYREENRDEELGMMWVNFGTMRDAGSFAGNIGAAAAEYVLENSTNYERTIGSDASDEERMRFYYQTRTTEEELLGELDAWGALPSLESGSVSTLTGLVRGYYGTSPRTDTTTTPHPRKAALENFISQYSLSTAGNTLVNNANLNTLSAINLTFAQGWWRFRKDTFGESSSRADLIDPCNIMTGWFLEFLTARANEYGVF